MRSPSVRPAAALAAAAVALAVVLAPSPAADKAPPKTIGSIERLDPRLDALIPKDAQIEVISDGYKWTEGPVWVKDGGFLLFTDIPNNRVVKWTARDGASDFVKPSGYTGSAPFAGQEPGANGLAVHPATGELVLCQHGDRKLSVLAGALKDRKGTEAPTFKPLAEKYMGKRFNSPNDLTFTKGGDILFTDPPYGLPKNVDDPAKELDFQGVYRLKPGGEPTLLTKEMTRPNGLALSPDEKTLYVANSDPTKAIWMAFPVKDDGTLGTGKVMYDATKNVTEKKEPGLPDGLKVDQKGNVFATGPNGVYVFAPDGTLLGRIVTNDRTANCAFGDDGSTLYICANPRMVRIKTTTKGQGF